MFQRLAVAGRFVVNEEDLINLFCAPGFLADFHALPIAAQTEVKENYRTDEIGTLQNGQFIQRLRGKRLTELKGYESLEGYMKMYLQGAQYRLIFKQSGNAVYFLACGPRADMACYKRAQNRARITNA